MDTPLKNQTSPTTPFPSKFEDSPVFNYIRNLSPIEPVKSRANDHTFNSLTFASPPSAFTSPQIVSPSETKFFLRRHHFSDSPKPEFFQSGNQFNKLERVSVAVQQSYLGNEQSECFTSASSGIEDTKAVPTVNLEPGVELPNTLKYNCGSPDSNVVPCDATDTDTVLETASTPASIVQSNERHSSFERESHLRRICGFQQKKEATGCDWVTLISDAADLLNFDSTTNEENSVGQDPKTVDPGTISFLSNILQDNHNDMEITESAASEQCEFGKFSTQSEGIGDLKETDQVPEILSRTLLDKLNVHDPKDIVDDKCPKCIHPSRQPSSQSHPIRRRCLDFERAETQKRKPICDSNGSSSVSLQSNCELASAEKKLIQITTSRDYSSSRLRGIGLHLNALATTSESNLSKVVEHETQVSESQVINMPNSEISCTSLTPSEVSRDESLILNSLENDLGPCKNEGQTCTPVNEEFDHSSPEKKRLKLQHVGESLTCKRCNCKRSKCLKLYCECFAAGLYCIEPCSCQDCFNKPAHENIVLETRRLIESRNPLAFAPKVIGSTDAILQFGEETNSTPSSARHKRGCNCRKSGCLKKYCECFQGGAGCSLLCRCIGCKNTFGRKDGENLSGPPMFQGAEETEADGEESGAREKNGMNVSLQTVRDQDHPMTPSEICRPSDQLPSTLNGRIKLFSLHSVRSSPQQEKHLQVIPENGTLETLDSSCSQAGGVKSTSPNSKRVSPPHSGSEFGSLNAWKGGRKLILRSIPPFPTLSSPPTSSSQTSHFPL